MKSRAGLLFRIRGLWLKVQLIITVIIHPFKHITFIAFFQNFLEVIQLCDLLPCIQLSFKCYKISCDFIARKESAPDYLL